MSKLVITGCSGFLGSHLARMASGHFEVIATYNKNPCQIDNVRTVQSDLFFVQDLCYLLEYHQPTAIIHTAALSNPNYCEQHPEESYQINVEATARIAMECNRLGIKMVFTSTDLVFDGKKGFYSEEEPTNPISVYGKHKVMAEEVIMETNENFCVCRMPLMFGKSNGITKSFIQPILENWTNNQPTNLFTDEYRSPIDATTASEGLLWAVKHASGIVHLGGSQRVSRYEFGQKMSNLLNITDDLIVPGLQSSVKMPAKRPADVSLNSSFSHAAGFPYIDLEEQIKRVLVD